jgi:hypothetical protein
LTHQHFGKSLARLLLDKARDRIRIDGRLQWNIASSHSTTVTRALVGGGKGMAK